MSIEVERRSGEDRRKKKFGRRGPKLLLYIANWLANYPNVFYAYIVINMIILFYTLANLAYDLNHSIAEFFRGLIK